MKSKYGWMVSFILACGTTALPAAETQVKLDGLLGPENLAFVPDGTLYLSDTDHVYKVAAGGSEKELVYQRNPATDGTSICGVTFGPDATIWFSAGNRIVRLDTRTGAMTTMTGEFGLANGACMDDAGNFYIADSGKRSLFVIPAGETEARVLVEKAGWVNGLVWNRSDRTLYASISMPGSVRGFVIGEGLKVEREFTFVEFKGAGLDDLTLDADGNFYVCQYTVGKVVKVTPSGDVSLLIEGIDGPSAVAFGVGDDASTLYLCEKGGKMKFEGTKLLSIETDARGYRLPFLP